MAVGMINMRAGALECMPSANDDDNDGVDDPPRTAGVPPLILTRGCYRMIHTGGEKKCPLLDLHSTL